MWLILWRSVWVKGVCTLVRHYCVLILFLCSYVLVLKMLVILGWVTCVLVTYLSDAVAVTRATVTSSKFHWSWRIRVWCLLALWHPFVGFQRVVWGGDRAALVTTFASVT